MQVRDVDVEAVKFRLGHLDVDLAKELVSERALVGGSEELARERPDVLPNELVLVFEEDLTQLVNLEPAAIFQVRELVVVRDRARDSVLVPVNTEVLEG